MWRSMYSRPEASVKIPPEVDVITNGSRSGRRRCALLTPPVSTRSARVASVRVSVLISSRVSDCVRSAAGGMDCRSLDPHLTDQCVEGRVEHEVPDTLGHELHRATVDKSSERGLVYD